MFILSISENILLFVSGIGIVQALLLSSLLVFHPKSERSVNKFLALYIIALTWPIILPVAQHLFSWQIMILLEPFLTLTGPLLYLYVRSFKEVITWKKALPHFIFFVVCIPLAMWDYMTVGKNYPPSGQVPVEATKQVLIYIPLGLRLIQRIIYYFLSRNILISYQRSIRHLFSDTSRINLNWVKWLINGFLFLIVVTLVFYTLMIQQPDYFGWWVLIPGVIVSIYIYLATFMGMTQSTLWQVRPELDQEKAEEEIVEAEKMESDYAAAGKNQPRRTGLNESRIDEITTKLIFLLESEKIYQEPDLTLRQLATKLQLPAHHLSQAINDGLQKNFYDLINNYRVDEAKRLLLDPRNKSYTILSVGFEAGFNSKTTFNTVFKKFTGLTPTEYRDKKLTAVIV